MSRNTAAAKKGDRDNGICVKPNMHTRTFNRLQYLHMMETFPLHLCYLVHLKEILKLFLKHCKYWQANMKFLLKSGMFIFNEYCFILHNPIFLKKNLNILEKKWKLSGHLTKDLLTVYQIQIQVKLNNGCWKIVTPLTVNSKLLLHLTINFFIS